MSTFKYIAKFLINFLVWLALGIFALSLITSVLSGASLLGDKKFLLVQSGSMEPSIMTGDIIVISSARQYFKNDVITFRDSSRGIVTHRIVDITTTGQKSIISTKGDANRSLDSDTISSDQIMGKVVLTLPKLGYLVNFTRQPLGLLIFIVFPASVIIIEEITQVLRSKKTK